jgi:hypothetical protein
VPGVDVVAVVEPSPQQGQNGGDIRKDREMQVAPPEGVHACLGDSISLAIP